MTSCLALLLLIRTSFRQSTSDLHPRPDRLSRKISRTYHPSQTAFETTDDNGAGPSGSNQEEWNGNEAVPTSPSTEYPDQFGGLPLPSYYHNAELDPVAFVSLEHGPPINNIPYTRPLQPLSPSQSNTESGPLVDGTFMSQ
jgi:hypothetical protein